MWLGDGSKMVVFDVGVFGVSAIVDSFHCWVTTEPCSFKVQQRATSEYCPMRPKRQSVLSILLSHLAPLSLFSCASGGFADIPFTSLACSAPYRTLAEIASHHKPPTKRTCSRYTRRLNVCPAFLIVKVPEIQE